MRVFRRAALPASKPLLYRLSLVNRCLSTRHPKRGGPKPVLNTASPNASSSRVVVLPKFSTVANLASLLKVRFIDLQKRMEDLGFSETHSDHIVDDESAKLIAEELGVESMINTNHGDDIYPQPVPENLSSEPARPPVIALMGHVDHGKTTLLDYFRSSSIVAGEKGGITQHIGAFSTILNSSKQRVCFLDTPGHEAFLKLRERGAHLTDLVLLVVAADDSVMPQTKEAIRHAKAANVPMIVAITKTDSPDSNPEKVIADLAAAGVDVEPYGGETQCIPISVVKRTGLDDLEVALTALMEVLDVRAPTRDRVEGVIVESQQLKGIGNVATAIVRRGVMTKNTTIVAGLTWCKVRSLTNENKKPMKEVLPGFPVQITGWRDLPEPGDTILEADTEDFAKKVADNRRRLLDEANEAKRIDEMNENRRREHEQTNQQQDRISRKQFGLKVEEPPKESDAGTENVLSYVIKADVAGSAEALRDSVQQLGNDEVHGFILFSGVGPVTESDIFRAEPANATIIAFGTQVSRSIEQLAEKKNVPIYRYDVIYKALERISADLSAKLAPTVKRTVTGTAEIREVFNIKVKKSSRKVAGVKVTKGLFSLKSNIQVLRGGKMVYEGKLASIQHGQDSVEEAHKNSEYGMTLHQWDDFERSDVIELYEETVIPRYL